MQATLLPLSGKYYGTKIIINNQGFINEITLWNYGNGEPSLRELRNKCTIEQWRNNDKLPVPDGWGSDYTFSKDYIGICDSHFESSTTYNLALEIVERLNK